MNDRSILASVETTLSVLHEKYDNVDAKLDAALGHLQHSRWSALLTVVAVLACLSIGWCARGAL